MPHAEDALEKITRSHARASTLRGRAFFVAWNGVLTMAYEGWTEGVARYKRALNDPEVGLQEEAHGSKWPKTSLACLRDGDLRTEELNVLRTSCEKFAEAVKEVRVALNRAKVVVFASRCCERRLSVRTLEMASGNVDNVDASVVSDANRDIVEDILRAGNAASYIDDVNRPGHRANHYENGAGVTLVVDCGETIGDLVDKFRAEVEARLPGRYRWFDTNSLHIAIRGLVN